MKVELFEEHCTSNLMSIRLSSISECKEVVMIGQDLDMLPETLQSEAPLLHCALDGQEVSVSKGVTLFCGG